MPKYIRCRPALSALKDIDPNSIFAKWPNVKANPEPKRLKQEQNQQ